MTFRMYVCGPTVHRRIHIGNARTFVDDRGFTFGLTCKNFIDAYFAAIKEPAPPREPLSDNPPIMENQENRIQTRLTEQ